MIILRLALAAKILRKVKPTKTRKFDMKYWHIKSDCGTVACAIGYLCMDERIKKLGLELEGDSPAYNKLIGFSAVEDFFEISERLAESLFGSTAYTKPAPESFFGARAYINPTPKEVADRIEKVLSVASFYKFS